MCTQLYNYYRWSVQVNLYTLVQKALKMEAKTKNMLRLHESLKLANWLNSKRSQPNWEKMSVRSLSELANSELGFSVTPHNIIGIAEASDLKIPNRRQTGKGVLHGKNQTRAKIRLLNKGLIELYQRLGESVPEYLNFSSEE